MPQVSKKKRQLVPNALEQTDTRSLFYVTQMLSNFFLLLLCNYIVLPS